MQNNTKTHEPIFLPGGKARLFVAVVFFVGCYYSFYALSAHFSS